jgi:MscS family membrane protein
MSEAHVPEQKLTETTQNSDWAGEYIRDFDAGKYLPEALHPLSELLHQHPVILLLFLFGLGYLLGKILQWLLHTVLGRIVIKTQTELDDQLLKSLAAPVVQTTVIFSLVLGAKVLSLGDVFEQMVIRFLFSLLLFLWARACFRVTSFALPALSAEGGRFKLLQPRTVPLFEMSIKLTLVSIFIWFFMAVWGIDGTAWLASAGVVGIAVGFAARDTLANLISGVSIVADAPYKIGDYIVLDSGERGIVSALGMRSTRLLTRDDVEISIPNAVMGNAKISNECGGPAIQHRIRVAIGVAYGTDTSRVVSVLEQVAREIPLIVDHPAPRVRMRAFGDSSLDFQLLGWISKSEQRGLATHQLLMEIDRRFREEGIQIPFPQRDVHFFDDSTQ